MCYHHLKLSTIDELNDHVHSYAVDAADQEIRSAIESLVVWFWRLSASYFFNALASAAFFSAQRFFVAATIAALPSALSTLFFFAGFAAFLEVAEPAFFSAHRFRCAAAIASSGSAYFARRLLRAQTQMEHGNPHVSTGVLLSVHRFSVSALRIL
jgi:hypothetical protein